jgi:hypothetical protein
VRSQLAALLVATTLAACTSASSGDARVSPEFSVQPLPSDSTASPLVEVKSGDVHAAVPDSWEARPLVDPRFGREGIVAAPRVSEWQRRTETARGMEAFWVDLAEMRIPSDYYYLAAHGPALSSIVQNKSCRQARRVFVDRPPDLTGRTFSPGDYVVSGTAICRTGRQSTHWAFLVAAPGYGPVRQVGIKTSGLYVVLVAVSGAQSKHLLREIIESTRFGNASVPQILKAARLVA